jgi:uncharacterized protein involved in type VI secretion and phage assembly
MAGQHFAADPVITISGQQLRSASNVVEVVIDTDLTAASSCTITMLDASREALKGFDYKAKVAVSAPGVLDAKLTELFIGEIYSMEFESDERGVYARVTAFDGSYRLKQHRVTKAYKNAKDSDIAKQIAGAVGVSAGRIKETKVLHEHIGQVNETYWDFLAARAAANGYEVHISKGKLDFCPPDPARSGPKPADHHSQDTLQLTTGKNLTHLRSRLTAAQQVDEVEVRGWDPKQKKGLVSTTAAKSAATELSVTAAGLAKKVGCATRSTPRPDFTTQAECDTLASSLAERTASAFAYAEGTALGDPRMIAGVSVSIGEAGNFDGKYTVTRARHQFRAGDYHTTFTVSGSHDRSQFGLTRESSVSDWGGTYPALVTDVADPEKQGRVKLTFPWLDESYVSDWSRLLQIGAGPGQGLQWSPEVGDEVLVSFLNGDPRHPTVLGGLYNGKDKVPFPDSVSSSGAVETRGLKSRTGNLIAFHDRKGEERIEITTASGSCTIVLNDKTKGIVIEANDNVSINAKKNVEIDAAVDVNVKSGGNLKIDATANAEFTAGANFKITAGAVVEIKGALVKLN